MNRRLRSVLPALGALFLALTPVQGAPAAREEQAQTVPYTDLGYRVQVIGPLGTPLGRYLTIEGRRAQQGKVGVQTLLVEKVDGKPLKTPVGLWVDNIRNLPAGTRCVLKGYETGRMIGTPPDVLRKAGLPAPQAGWQFQVVFIAVQVVEPPSLKKDS